jgi:hypothetical protein
MLRGLPYKTIWKQYTQSDMATIQNNMATMQNVKKSLFDGTLCERRWSRKLLFQVYFYAKGEITGKVLYFSHKVLLEGVNFK